MVKKLEEATAKHSDCKMGAFVVLLTDDEKAAETKLKDLVDKEKLKKVVLCVDAEAGPANYKIAKDADVTVVLYVKKTAKVNFVFEKGKFTEKSIDKVLDAVKEILPKDDEKKSK